MLQSDTSPPVFGELDAPPAEPGQSQPWKEWFNPKDLDTNEPQPDDDKLQNCHGMTQAITNIG